MMRLILVFLCFAFLTSSAQIDKENKRKGKYKNAIFLPSDGRWYNVEKPIKNFANRKKLTLLNFWNPEQIYGSSLVQRINAWKPEHLEYEIVTVVDENALGNLDQQGVEDLIIQNEIRHPVCVVGHCDSIPGLGNITFPMWALLDVDGELIEKYKGPLEIETAWPVLDSLGVRGMRMELVHKVYIGYPYLPDRAPKSILGYLTYIECAPLEALMFISDQKKHRIIMVDVDGQSNQKIGLGEMGFEDGRSPLARFNGPAGMAYDPAHQILYVADTYNHAIRQVDLRYDVVTTILGTGEAGMQPPNEVVGTTGRLSYPTDIELKAGKLYIAMTGYNQIWVMDLKTGKAVPFVGNGKLDSQDGKLGDAALFAPRNLEFNDSGDLLFSEPKTGKIRSVSPKGKVKTIYEPQGDTLVGDLLTPRGLQFYNGDIYVTDVGSDRICQVNKNQLLVFAGSGEEGHKNGKGMKASFNKPVDMVLLEGEFYVLDTGSDLIRRVNVKNSRVNTLQFTRIGALTQYEEAISKGEDLYMQAVEIGSEDNLVGLNIELGEGYHLLDYGRNQAGMDDAMGFNEIVSQDFNKGQIEIFVKGDPDNTNIQFELYLTYYHEDLPEAIFYKSVMVLIPLEYRANASGYSELTYYVTRDFIER